LIENNLIRETERRIIVEENNFWFFLVRYLEEIISEEIHRVKMIIVMDRQSKKEYSDNKSMKSVMGCFIVKIRQEDIKIIIFSSQDFVNLVQRIVESRQRAIISIFLFCALVWSLFLLFVLL